MDHLSEIVGRLRASSRRATNAGPKAPPPSKLPEAWFDLQVAERYLEASLLARSIMESPADALVLEALEALLAAWRWRERYRIVDGELSQLIPRIDRLMTPILDDGARLAARVGVDATPFVTLRNHPSFGELDRAEAALLALRQALAKVSSDDKNTPVPPARNQPSMKEPLDGAWLSEADLARAGGVNQHTLRTKLRNWRDLHPHDWRGTINRLPNDPAFLYRWGAAKKLIADLPKTGRKPANGKKRP